MRCLRLPGHVVSGKARVSYSTFALCTPSFMAAGGVKIRLASPQRQQGPLVRNLGAANGRSLLVPLIFSTAPSTRRGHGGHYQQSDPPPERWVAGRWPLLAQRASGLRRQSCRCRHIWLENERGSTAIVQHLADHHDRCGADEDHEDSGKNEQHERENNLHAGLLSLFFGHLPPLDSHAI